MNIAPFISLTTSEVPCKCGFTFIYGVLLKYTFKQLFLFFQFTKNRPLSLTEHAIFLRNTEHTIEKYTNYL
jgi:hypothetical protein